METKLTQFAVAVVGKAHNPTILNPDFLAIRRIVPAEWGWEVEATVTTPMLAFVRYNSGVSITVETEKLQVADGRCTDATESKAPEIAQRYIATLPHVKYTATGNNFHAVVELDDPSAYLKSRFLKPGRWDSDEERLDSFGLRFVYPLRGGRVLLSLDIGELKEKEDGTEKQSDVIVVGTNFHRDCTKYPADAEVKAYIERYRDDWIRFAGLFRTVLGIDWNVN